MSKNEQISSVVALSLIGVAVSSVLNTPVPPLTELLDDFGQFPLSWLLLFLTAVLTGAGTDSVLRSLPEMAGQRLAYLLTFNLLPTLWVIIGTALLQFAPSIIVWAGGVVLIGIILWLLLSTGYQTVVGSKLGWVVWSLLSYGVLYLGLFVIWQLSLNPLGQAILTWLVTGAVSGCLLRQQPKQIGRTWLFALIIGLTCGQIGWGLWYWLNDPTLVPFLLTLFVYALTNGAQHQLRGQLFTRFG